MKFIKLLILTAVTLAGAAKADGMPRPWPFPWAVECPMDWNSLNGRYRMTDSQSRDQLIVRVNEDHSEVKTIRIARMTSRGNVRSVGLAMVHKDEREVKVQMVPIRKGDRSAWVFLRMYHQSEIASCESENLVPILTVSKRPDPDEDDALKYLLVKVPQKASRN